MFSGGECGKPRDFVARHQRLAEHGPFVAGNRVLLSEEFTAQALTQRLRLQDWRVPDWLRAWACRDVNRWLPLVRLPDSRLRKLSPRRWQGITTCNLSAWRRDLIRVNGLDESYTGWGLEDSDLVVRLLRAGLRHKSARFAAPLYHLWHGENDRSRLEENRRRLEKMLASSRTEALLGVRQYL